MRDVPSLVDGYRRFLGEQYKEKLDLYRKLAKGQAPQVMVVSCCDSRVDPSTVFSAGPGELFVVRNVANLVPPYGPSDDFHGTSAALEFAVTGLGVQHIVVLGHSGCGGIKACLEGPFDKGPVGSFIGKWMSIMQAPRADVLKETDGQPFDVKQKALEHAAIGQSLANLETFPFVEQKIAEGKLRLHGAYFEIGSGTLFTLDRQSRSFSPLL